jgi:Protein of unknown function (DUF2970)
MIGAGSRSRPKDIMSDSPNDTPKAPPAGEAEQAKPSRLGAVSLVGSIAAAAFGVQSSRSRERDFTQGNYRHFIIGGIVFTIVFVLTIVAVVRFVLGGR